MRFDNPARRQLDKLDKLTQRFRLFDDSARRFDDDDDGSNPKEDDNTTTSVVLKAATLRHFCQTGCNSQTARQPASTGPCSLAPGLTAFMIQTVPRDSSMQCSSNVDNVAQGIVFWDMVA